MSDSHVPALHAALSLALSARTGAITPHHVEEARIRAEELLAEDHPARRAVITFATMYEQFWRDPDQIRKQGEYLQDALGQALNPDAVAPRIIYGGYND